MKIIFATKNDHKYKELKSMLSSLNITLLSLNDYPEIKDIEETGSSFIENALLKAETIAKRTLLPVLADDSGLEVEYLDNRPGIYSKRYAPTDQARINKLLKEMKNVSWINRQARFTCAMVFINKNKNYKVLGFCHGFISYKPEGKNGFGYDPIFYLSDLGKTMAQLTEKQKNMISHRSNALKQIKELLKSIN